MDPFKYVTLMFVFVTIVVHPFSNGLIMLAPLDAGIISAGDCGCGNISEDGAFC